MKAFDSKVVLPCLRKEKIYYIYTNYVLTCILIWKVCGNVVSSGWLNLKDSGLFMFGYKRYLSFTFKVTYLNIDLFEWRVSLRCKRSLNRKG